MKNLMILAVVVSVGALFALTSCGGGQLGGQVKGETFVTEGWVDDNTYRITSVGCPGKISEGRPDLIQRRDAKEAARLDAQRMVLVKFKGEAIEAAAGMKDFEVSGVALAAEVEGMVKGGSIIQETYDQDNCCEIIYEVTGRNLRKRVLESEIR